MLEITVNADVDTKNILDTTGLPEGDLISLTWAQVREMAPIYTTPPGRPPRKPKQVAGTMVFTRRPPANRFKLFVRVPILLLSADVELLDEGGDLDINKCYGNELITWVGNNIRSITDAIDIFGIVNPRWYNRVHTFTKIAEAEEIC